MNIKNKIIKAINADNEAKKLKITFMDGSLGQLTYKQIEQFYGMFNLPDMLMKPPEFTGEVASKGSNQNNNSNSKIVTMNNPYVNNPINSLLISNRKAKNG